jgi:hypothetical protein
MSRKGAAESSLLTYANSQLATSVKTLRSLTLMMVNPVANDRADRDHLDSENEEEDLEELAEQLEKIEIDPSKLTPLSPEVISKQVRCFIFLL